MLEEILEFTWLINDRGFVVKSFSRIFSHDYSYLWQVLELNVSEMSSVLVIINTCKFTYALEFFPPSLESILWWISYINLFFVLCDALIVAYLLCHIHKWH